MPASEVVASMRGQVEGAAPTLHDQMTRLVPEVERAVGTRANADRLIRIALTEVRKTPKLGECTFTSIAGAVLQSAQLRLDPGGALGHCWLVPHWNGQAKAMECEWWLGYKGTVELAHRSGQLSGITADVVREGDLFFAVKGTHGELRHEVDWRATREQRGEVYAAYAHANLINGGDVWVVLTLEQLEERRALAKSADKASSPWRLWPDQMQAKTAVRALDRWLPACADYADGVAADGRVVRWDPDRPGDALEVDGVDAADLLAAMPGHDEDGADDGEG